jgi:hypothetical protein
MVISSVNPYDIHGRQSRSESGLSSSFFGFALIIMIPLLLHTHIFLPPVMGDSPEQAAPYHIVGL